MNSDAYHFENFIDNTFDPSTIESDKDRSSKIKEAYSKNKFINKKMEKASNEINKMSNLPPSIDWWIDSFSTSPKDFKLADFNKIIKITKDLDKLQEEKENNLRNLKLLMIDELLEKAEKVLEK